MTEKKIEYCFEKDYEFPQEITYPVNGTFKKTKTVILKAPIMRIAEKFEKALGKGPIEIIKFICDNGLVVAPDNTPIPNLEELHALAMMKLQRDYLKYFFDLDSLDEEEKKSQENI